MQDLGIITGALLATIGLASAAAFSRPHWIGAFLLEVAAVRRGEYVRLLSSGFLHANWAHLLVNLLSFYFFANVLERVHGPVLVAVVFFVGVVGGNLLALALHWNEPDYRALGASGGVCGVIFAAVFLLPGISVFILPIPFPIPAWLYAIFFVLYSVQGTRSRRDNVGHDAHLGGALLGLLAATAFAPELVLSQGWLFALITIGSLGAIVYLYRLSRAG